MLQGAEGLRVAATAPRPASARPRVTSNPLFENEGERSRRFGPPGRRLCVLVPGGATEFQGPTPTRAIGMWRRTVRFDLVSAARRNRLLHGTQRKYSDRSPRGPPEQGADDDYPTARLAANYRNVAVACPSGSPGRRLGAGRGSHPGSDRESGHCRGAGPVSLPSICKIRSRSANWSVGEGYARFCLSGGHRPLRGGTASDRSPVGSHAARRGRVLSKSIGGCTHVDAEGRVGRCPRLVSRRPSSMGLGRRRQPRPVCHVSWCMAYAFSCRGAGTSIRERRVAVLVRGDAWGRGSGNRVAESTNTDASARRT